MAVRRVDPATRWSPVALLPFAGSPARRLRATGASNTKSKPPTCINIVNFVTWPPDAFGGPADPLHVCRVRHGSVRAAARQRDAEAARSNGDPIRSMRIGDIAAVCATCHLVFVPHDSTDRTDQAVRAAAQRPVLTVGESADFLQRGGMIAFVVEGGRVRFDVNLQAAAARGLTLSSRLLQVARDGRPAKAAPDEALAPRRPDPPEADRARPDRQRMRDAGRQRRVPDRRVHRRAPHDARGRPRAGGHRARQRFGRRSRSATARPPPTRSSALRALPIIDLACTWDAQGQFFAAYQPRSALLCPPSPPGTSMQQTRCASFEIGRAVIVGRPSGRHALHARQLLQRRRAASSRRRYATLAALFLGALAAILHRARCSSGDRGAGDRAGGARRRRCRAHGDYSVRAAQAVRTTRSASWSTAFNDMLAQIQRRDDELADGEPAEGRVPRDRLARASHAAECDSRLAADSADDAGVRRTPAAGAQEPRPQRPRAGAARRGSARRLAHRRRQAAAEAGARRSRRQVVDEAIDVDETGRRRQEASASTCSSTRRRISSAAIPIGCSRRSGTCWRTP